MKCVCGYEIIEDIKAIQEPFIFLGEVTAMQNNKSFYVDKFACPKCGTVKIEIETHRS